MSLPEVFIIESLRFQDEEGRLFEGRLLCDMLHLSGKKALYYYIRTKRELERIIHIFHNSEYRYLHLSCHANEQTMATTLDEIDFFELGNILRPVLQERRLFLSACEMTNNRLARIIFPNSGCFSVIGPKKKVAFNDATILWSSFYHLMFSDNPFAMKRKKVLEHVQNVSNMFRVPMNYFSSDKRKRGGYSFTGIRPKLPK